jgi:hypothetical protein
LATSLGFFHPFNIIDVPAVGRFGTMQGLHGYLCKVCAVADNSLNLFNSPFSLTMKILLGLELVDFNAISRFSSFSL